MGFRIYYRGVFVGDLTNLVRTKNVENPYISYGALQKQLVNNGDSVRRNLRMKVEKGFISLEELLAGGRATGLFKNAGLFEEAVEKLSVRIAVSLVGRPRKMERFLISGRESVPYVVEYLPAEGIANALRRVSQPVQQRSVIDLIKIPSIWPSYYDKNIRVIPINFKLVYDKEEITTEYLPYNVQKIFCFKREAARVTEINRGVVLNDRFVANTIAILDALDNLKTSPLDCILISLRGIQGILRPSSRSTWPMLKRDEFIPRDHFTRKVRQIFHEEVCRQYENMQKNGGAPLSFRVNIRRIGEGEYTVDFIWVKKQVSL